MTDPRVVDTKLFLFAYLFLLYAPAGLMARRWLLPHLARPAKYFVVAMLVAQVCVIAISMAVQLDKPEDPGLRAAQAEYLRLWHLGAEYSIAAFLSTAQLGLVGAFAVMLARIDHVSAAAWRFYLFAVGLCFLFMGWDEFAMIHESMPNWGQIYTVIGAAVVAPLVIVSARSPRRIRWCLCFWTGLAIAAFGAIHLDKWRYVDFDGVWIFRFTQSVSETPFEEPLEIVGIWLVLVAMLGFFSIACEDGLLDD